MVRGGGPPGAAQLQQVQGSKCSKSRAVNAANAAKILTFDLPCPLAPQLFQSHMENAGKSHDTLPEVPPGTGT